MKHVVEIDQACLRLAMLLMNPYAVRRREEKKRNLEEAWREMAKKHSTKRALIIKEV